MATLSRKPSTTFDSTSSNKPHAVYNGGYENAKLQGVRLRIANGGAGQIGLIRAWADGFIQYMVSEGMPPFEVRPRLCVKTQSTERFSVVMTGCVVYRGHHRKPCIPVLRYCGCCPYLQSCCRKTTSRFGRRSGESLWLQCETVVTRYAELS